MIEKNLFDDLKKYLTKEFLTLSKKKDEKLAEKVAMETKKQREEQQLFNYGDTARIKRLFSPLEEEIFDNENINSYKNNKILQKIQDIEVEIKQMEESMEEIKNYLSFIQNIEKSPLEDKQQEIKRENIETESGNLKEILTRMMKCLQEKYEATEILLDFDEDIILSDTSFSSYFMDILVYTIEKSIETSKVDTVIVEGKTEDGKWIISLQMLLEETRIDQYCYQYEIIQKGK